MKKRTHRSLERTPLETKQTQVVCKLPTENRKGYVILIFEILPSKREIKIVSRMEICKFIS